jgi:formylglycine-generating enzyme required for sulfatase activity
MHVKSSLLSAVLLVAASSLSIDSTAQDNPNYHKSHTRPVIPFKHATLAAPPGMVYVPGGTVTIKYSQSSTDTNSKKRVSLSSFYIDKTEVTNQQYRMFTEWIIDSIAVTQFIKDDKYFMDYSADKKKDGASKDVTTTTTTTTTDTAMASLTPTDPSQPAAPATTTTTTATVAAAGTASTTATTKDSVKQKRRLNWAKISHKGIFESNDEEIKAKIAPMFDERGKIKKELYSFPFSYLKATGTNQGVKPGEYATENINIFPDEQVWFRDINNSQVEILVENYFTAPPFDDYPVVGINWKQARAFAYWRSLTNADFAYIADYLKYYRLQYSLPSEAQWVYAAGKDMKALQERQKEDDEMFASDSAANALAAADTVAAPAVATPTDAVATTKDTTGLVTSDNSGLVVNEKDNTSNKEEDKDSKKKKKKKEKSDDETDKVVVKKKGGLVDRDRDGALLVNFKQEEGEDTADGANFTLPVMSYAPNEFGVYNMVGNVAEWVLDAYSPSTFAFVSDVNPVLLYDADTTDADAMKRKVVRGGSFMSNAKALSPFSRDYYLQNDVHCYIGFRCVMAAPDILNRSVSTRRRTTVTEKKAK